ncbi:hypothetical protein CW752_06575 [Chryseobacterium sp. PMSZPI]|nr:hypothetical protein CW752_06575 [Chryseobacterium sp. PMSZPI]
MKPFLALLLFLSILSCKKAQGNISNQIISNKITIDKNWNGDPLISDINFVNSIDASCKLNTPFFNRSEKQVKEDDAKCALSKIKFSYDKLDSINKKITVGRLSSEIELFIKKSSLKITNEADLNYQATLYIEKNKSISDSIIIYQSFNNAEALTVKTKYYYLEKNDIYLLDIVDNESGTSTEKWEHYKINAAGKISLVQQKLFTKGNKYEVLYFDNDNINDKIDIQSKQNTEFSKFILSIYLSSLNKTIEIPILNNSILLNNIETDYYLRDPIINNKVITLQVDYANQVTKPNISGEKKDVAEKMRFRFDAKNKKIQIIGYDISYSKAKKNYSKSFNFITGKFYSSSKVDGKKEETSGWTAELQNIYVENWNQDFFHKLILYGNEIE